MTNFGYDWNFSISVADSLAVLISTISIWISLDTKKRQDRLNELQINQAQKSEILDRKADIRAELIILGNGDYRVQILNAGNCEARNLLLNYDSANQFFMSDEVEKKVNGKSLQHKEEINLRAIICIDSAKTQKIELNWDDDFQKGNSKEFELNP